MYLTSIQNYPESVYRQLTTTWYAQTSIKWLKESQLTKDPEQRALADKQALLYEKLTRSESLFHDDLWVMGKSKRMEFYRQLRKLFLQKNQQFKRLQFDPVKMLIELRKIGYEIVDIVNYWRDDVVYRPNRFQILLKNEDRFLLLEDGFRNSGRPLILSMGVWTPEHLTTKATNRPKVAFTRFLSLSHRKSFQQSYLQTIKQSVRTVDAVAKKLRNKGMIIQDIFGQNLHA